VTKAKKLLVRLGEETLLITKRVDCPRFGGTDEDEETDCKTRLSRLLREKGDIRPAKEA